MSLISRLYDFVSQTRIKSVEVDNELNQLVAAHNSHDGTISTLILKDVDLQADIDLANATADSALATAGNAVTAATGAVNTANTASTNSTNALNMANTAINTANTASGVATAASNKATQVETDFNAIEPIIQQAVVDANAAVVSVASKVDLSYVNQVAADFQMGVVLPDSITEAQIAPAFKNKVSTLQSDVTALEAEINTPTMSTITLDESTKIMAYYDSYASPSDFVIGGETLYNVVTNGDFSGGTTGWTATGGTISIDTGALKLITSVSGGYVNAVNVAKVNTKYFYKLKVKCEASPFSVYVGEVGNNYVATVGFKEIYGTITPTTSVSLFGFLVANVSTAYIDNVVIVPMTGTPYALYSEAQMNGLVNKYIDKLQGAKEVTVGSRGNNKFDGKFVGKTYKEKLFSSSYDYLEFRVKPNTQYTLSFDVETVFIDDMYLVDSSGAFTAITRSTVGRKVGSRTSLSDGLLYIAIARSDSPFAIPKSWYETYLTNWTLFEGVGTEYEPYQGSQAVISATRHKLPNGVEDELRFVDGEWEFGKKANEKLLVSADVNALDNGTYAQRVYISNPSTKLIGLTSLQSGIIYFQSGHYMFTGDPDTQNYQGRYYKDTNNIILFFPLGTYANLAAAQAALAGTKVVYQLATPLIIKEANFAQYGITVEGSLSSNLDYTEYFVADHDIMAGVDISYATNLAKAVEQLKDSVDGLREAVDGKASKVQKPWITPTLLNGWTAFGGSLGGAKYFVDDFGEVNAEINVGGGITIMSTTILQFSIGARPSSDVYFTIFNSDGISIISNAQVFVDQNGYLKIVNAPYNGHLGIMIKFKAVQL